MSQARSNKDRVHQIARWLAAEFQTPYPVTVRCVKKIAAHRNDNLVIRKTGYYGETERVGRRIIIRVAVRPSISRYSMTDTLLHEWAHAVSLRHDIIEDKRLDHGAHDDEWGLAHGKIYRRFYDDGGSEDSENY